MQKLKTISALCSGDQSQICIWPETEQSNAHKQTCDILKDTSLTGIFDFSYYDDFVTINLNGHTISGSFTLILGGMYGSNLNGSGTINGNIEIANAWLRAPLTVNGDISQAGNSDFRVEGSGILYVNGNIDDFVSPSSIGSGVTIVCTGTCSETDIQDRVITQPQNITLSVSPEGSGSVTATGIRSLWIRAMPLHPPGVQLR